MARTFGDASGTMAATWRIARATWDASDLSAARTFTLPDASGTMSLVGHGHAIADTTGLQAALDGKQPLAARLTDLTTATINNYGDGGRALVVFDDNSEFSSSQVSTFIETLLDDTSASAARTTLDLAAIAASGSAADLSTGIIPDARMPNLTGDVTTSEGAVATTIANGAVSLAKMANLAQDTLIGRATASTGVPETITCTAAARALLDDASAAAQRTTLGGTTIGQALFTLINPGAITFPRLNADNTVTARAAADFRSDLGLGTIATQAANNVAITGGTVNGTSVGATTPSTGAFTTLRSTGRTSVSGAFDAPAINGLHFGFDGGTTGRIIALENGVAWRNLDIESATTTFKSSGSTIGTITSAGISSTAAVTSSGATSGIGYATGAGGTITQATNKATAVTLNKVCGEITMNAAALAAGTIVAFALNNTAIAATDVLVLNHVTTGTRGAYSLNAQCTAGGATIYVRNNTAGSLSEAIVIRFAVIKGVTA